MRCQPRWCSARHLWPEAKPLTFTAEFRRWDCWQRACYRRCKPGCDNGLWPMMRPGAVSGGYARPA
eukprot:7171053-Prymnesium_polylepis.1